MKSKGIELAERSAKFRMRLHLNKLFYYKNQYLCGFADSYFKHFMNLDKFLYSVIIFYTFLKSDILCKFCTIITVILVFFYITLTIILTFFPNKTFLLCLFTSVNFLFILL